MKSRHIRFEIFVRVAWILTTQAFVVSRRELTREFCKTAVVEAV